MRLRVLALLIASLVSAGCLDMSPSHDEVARLPSPDKSLDALIIESNGGATTSYWYDICLVPHGGSCSVADSVANLYGATRNDSAYGVNVAWGNGSAVEIEFLSAQRASLKSQLVRVAGRDVRLALRPGVRDANAPSGSMLYNISARKSGVL